MYIIYITFYLMIDSVVYHYCVIKHELNCIYTIKVNKSAKKICKKKCTIFPLNSCYIVALDCLPTSPVFAEQNLKHARTTVRDFLNLAEGKCILGNTGICNSRYVQPCAGHIARHPTLQESLDSWHAPLAQRDHPTRSRRSIIKDAI